MSADIVITVDAPKRLMIIRLGGFFDLADVQRLDVERRRAFNQIGCAINEHLTLCDVRNCALSTPEVVAALQKVIGNPLYRSKRCALIINGVLNRLQARRAVQHDGLKMFDDEEHAWAWLLRGAHHGEQARDVGGARIQGGVSLPSARNAISARPERRPQ